METRALASVGEDRHQSRAGEETSPSPSLGSLGGSPGSRQDGQWVLVATGRDSRCPLCSPQLSTLPREHETDCPQRLVLRSPILQKSGPWLRALKPLFHLSICQRRTRKISRPLEKDATKESIKSSSAGRRQRCIHTLYLTAPPLPHEKAAFLYRQQHARCLEATLRSTNTL